MPFLPLVMGIRHLPHVFTVPPTKACLLCATPAGMDLYIQVHARRLLPSAVPWISEDRLLKLSAMKPRDNHCGARQRWLRWVFCDIYRWPESCQTTASPWGGSCKPLSWRLSLQRSTMFTMISSATRMRSSQRTRVLILRVRILCFFHSFSSNVWK